MNEKINPDRITEFTETSEITVQQSNDLENSGKWSKKKITIATIITIFLAMGLALLFTLVISPMIAKKNAQDILDGAISNQGNLTVINDKVETFTGQSISGADVNQKMLSGKKNGEKIGTESGVFVFSNGKESNQKVVEVFVDFNSQTSRDFLLLNMPSFKKMIEGGLIDLHIKPVPTNDAFTMYASEAIAKTISNQPDRAWDFMTELLKLSALNATDKPADLVGSIVETAKKSKVEGITPTVIQSGSFASWFVATGNDQRLKVGYYPPVIYLNGQLLDQERVNINDQDALREYILRK